MSHWLVWVMFLFFCHKTKKRSISGMENTCGAEPQEIPMPCSVSKNQALDTIYHQTLGAACYCNLT